MRSRSLVAQSLALSATLACVLCVPASRADGPSSGFPVCTMPGEQGPPAAIPTVFDGPVSSQGALLFWRDQRGLPADAGDLWSQWLSGAGWGDVLPVDGNPAVQRPGTQAQPIAVQDHYIGCGLQWGCTGTLLAYTDAPGDSTRTVRVRRIDGTLAWDVAASLSPNDAFDPSIALDAAPDGLGRRGAIVSWLEDEGGGWTRLRVQHLASDGTRMWGDSGFAVCSDTSWQTHASMVPAPGGGVYLAWNDGRPDRDVSAIRLDQNGQPAAGWPAEGLALQAWDGAPHEPRIAEDGTGGLLVSWDRIEQIAMTWGLQPRVIRLLGNGAVASGWPADGLRLVDRHDSPAALETLQRDGAGGLVASLRYWPATVSRVLVQRVLLDGTRPPGWPPGGLDACAAPGEETESCLSAVDGVVTVGWSDGRDTPAEPDIYVARLLADGSRPAGWPAEGLGVGVAPGVQHAAVVVPGFWGGVRLAWQDGRELVAPVLGTGWDVWANTVTAAGRVDVDAGIIPATLSLAFAGRQPAAGAVRFRLALPEPGPVRAEVFDLSGRRVATLEDGPMEAGVHDLVWAGAGAGNPGVRFLRVRTPAGERALRFVTLD